MSRRPSTDCITGYYFPKKNKTKEKLLKSLADSINHDVKLNLDNASGYFIEVARFLDSLTN